MTDSPKILCLAIDTYNASEFGNFANDLKPFYDNQFPWEVGCWETYALASDIKDSNGNPPPGTVLTGEQLGTFFEAFDVALVLDAPAAITKASASGFATALGFFTGDNKCIAGYGNGILLPAEAGTFEGIYLKDTTGGAIPVAGATDLANEDLPSNLAYQSAAAYEGKATTGGGVITTSKTDGNALGELATNMVNYKGIHP